MILASEMTIRLRLPVVQLLSPARIVVQVEIEECVEKFAASRKTHSASAISNSPGSPSVADEILGSCKGMERGRM